MIAPRFRFSPPAGLLAVFLATTLGIACSGSSAVSPPARTIPVIRVVTFGDSHVDFGIKGDKSVDVSYISQDLILSGVKLVHSQYSLAGKLEALSNGSLRIEAINHGIGGTSSDASYRLDGEPNALAVSNGFTRFEAEVLGRGGPDWDAGTGKRRVFSFQPTSNDFVYVSVGTMDVALRLDTAVTRQNVRKMISLWKAAGLPASHFMLATLTPNVQLKPDFPGKLAELNAVFAHIAAEDGITLVDVSAKTRMGEDWIPGTTGEGLHGNEGIVNWVAQEIVNKAVQLRQ